MKFITILLLFISLNSSAQNIQLRTCDECNEIQVVSGKYTIRFDVLEIITVVHKLDSFYSRDSKHILEQLKQKDSSKTLNISSYLTDVINNDLGAFLLRKGKAKVFKNETCITQIKMDSSPAIKSLDGSIRTSIRFTDEDDELIFLGEVNVRFVQLNKNY